MMTKGSRSPADDDEPDWTSESPRGRLDTTVPHPARRYDFLLGGKDNFAADRTSAEELLRAMPTAGLAAIENRRFLQRVVAFLAREMGIRQFLDIGTGIPTSPNVHEIAQAIAPVSRIVYVDNDPLVMAHTRALMTSEPEGATSFVHADLRWPETILAHPALRATLNLRKPVALLLIAVLHFLTDEDKPHAKVAHLIEALPPGSVVVLSHVTFDPLTDETVKLLTALAAPEAGHGPFQARDENEVARFLDGLEPVDPGLVSIVHWLPEETPKPEASAADTAVYGVVARKPGL
jgi:hypothetical protein